MQFSKSTQFSSIWSLDRTLSGATIPCQSGPGSDGNKGALHIRQSSSVTGTSPSDCLVSYLETRCLGSYPSAEKQSVYSTAAANWVTGDSLARVHSRLQWSSCCSLQPSPSRLGNKSVCMFTLMILENWLFNEKVIFSLYLFCHKKN